MTRKRNQKKETQTKNAQEKKYVPYSEWSKDVMKMIEILVDECLDRFKDDKKTNTEILKMLSKLQTLVEKKYSE